MRFRSFLRGAILGIFGLRFSLKDQKMVSLSKKSYLIVTTKAWVDQLESLSLVTQMSVAMPVGSMAPQ